MADGQKSLKRRNAPAVAGVLIADVVILTGASAWPWDLRTAGWWEQVAGRAALAAIIPVLVLLLASLLPASVKAVLVFWRIRHTLPGHRAFEEPTLADPRIDVARLRKNIGQFPANPPEQNTTWYRLFKKVEQDVSVQHVHGQFLLLRDIAALSAMLLIAAIPIIFFSVAEPHVGVATVILLTAQYLLAALSARSQGKGLVASVLALHGAKRHA